MNNVRFVPSVAKNEMNEVTRRGGCCIAILKPIELYKTTYPKQGVSITWLPVNRCYYSSERSDPRSGGASGLRGVNHARR